MILDRRKYRAIESALFHNDFYNLKLVIFILLNCTVFGAAYNKLTNRIIQKQYIFGVNFSNGTFYVVPQSHQKISL